MHELLDRLITTSGLSDHERVEYAEANNSAAVRRLTSGQFGEATYPVAGANKAFKLEFVELASKNAERE